MSDIYKGVAFPFSFNSRGGVSTSILSPNDYSRIKESITHIITTRKGESPMRPDFGTNADNYIFEDFEDETTIGMLRYELEEAIERAEPRVSLQNLNAWKDEKTEQIFVEVEIKIIKFQITETIKVEITE